MPVEEVSPAYQNHAQYQQREYEQANCLRAHNSRVRGLRFGIALWQGFIVSLRQHRIATSRSVN